MDTYALPKDHVIALCHGFLGFDKLGFGDFGVNYFSSAAKVLKDNNYNVITPKVSMTKGIEVRAQELDTDIRMKLKELKVELRMPADTKFKVHLIGHSMGGLDARRLVCEQEAARKDRKPLEYEVWSVTTVSTPHHGSPAGDCAKSIGFTGAVGLLASPIVKILEGLSTAMFDLKPESMAEFNEKYKNVPTVKYYSTTSTFSPWPNHLFYLPHKHIKKYTRYQKCYEKAYGENDGMVSFESARWGVFLDDLVPKQATSHVGIVGWGLTGILAGDSNYDASTVLYPALVKNIAKNVVGQ